MGLACTRVMESWHYCMSRLKNFEELRSLRSSTYTRLLRNKTSPQVPLLATTVPLTSARMEGPHYSSTIAGRPEAENVPPVFQNETGLLPAAS